MYLLNGGIYLPSAGHIIDLASVYNSAVELIYESHAIRSYPTHPGFFVPTSMTAWSGSNFKEKSIRWLTDVKPNFGLTYQPD